MIARHGCLFIWGVYIRMGTYKRDALLVAQMRAYIFRVLIFYGCLLSRFYGDYNSYAERKTSIYSQTSRHRLIPRP